MKSKRKLKKKNLRLLLPTIIGILVLVLITTLLLTLYPQETGTNFVDVVQNDDFNSPIDCSDPINSLICNFEIPAPCPDGFIFINNDCQSIIPVNNVPDNNQYECIDGDSGHEIVPDYPGYKCVDVFDDDGNFISHEIVPDT